MAVYTPSISEFPEAVDFSALSGCEEITRLLVYISSKTEKVIVPNMPNLEYCYFFSAFESPVGKIDLSATEKVATVDPDALTEELIIGKGTESLILGKGFDLSKISGGENLKSITLHSGADLSLIAGISSTAAISGIAARRISHPAFSSSTACFTLPSISVEGTLIIDCIATGLSPPMAIFPILTSFAILVSLLL